MDLHKRIPNKPVYAPKWMVADWKGLALTDVLVTGGAGFIGSHLVEKLVDRGFNVRVLDNNWRGGRRNLGNLVECVEFIDADIRNLDKVNEATKGVETIYHLASIQGTKYFYSNPELVLEVGVLGSMNVAKAAAQNKIKRIVFASTSEVYGSPQYFPTDEKHPITIPDIKNPRWSYSAQKIIGESIFMNFARRFEFDATIVRIHNAYGPKMGWEHVIPEFIKKVVLNEKFIVEGNGTETRCFCFISDMIEGIILAGTKDIGKNEIFNLGNPNEENTINELIRLIGRISGKKVTPIYTRRKEGSPERRKPDISKALKLLKYEPKVNLENGLKQTFDWYQKEIEWWVESKKPDEYPWKK